MNIYLKQKLYIISFIISINALLTSTMIIYLKYWYIYLIFLLLAPILNCIYAITLLYNKIKSLKYTKNNAILLNNNINIKSLIIFVPCYNETLDELISTFYSIYEQ